jgi:flagellar motor switch protein FliN/FliY
VLMCLECLLGGSPDRPPRERRLSEIDWVLTRRLFESIVHQLSVVWQELGGVTLSSGEIEVHTDASQIASVSEPTFVVMIESRVNKHSAALALLIPWLAIEPIAQHVAGRDQAASEEDESGSGLTELELSAVAEAANQTMAAAASAIGVVLGQPVAISPPDTRVLDNPSTAADLFGAAPHATSTTFLIGGESCRLIQLVPSAFVVRMARAMDELSAERSAGEANGASGEDAPETVGLHEALGEIKLRVWAELGRTRMPLGKALSLPLGAVVDLDRPADAPVDLYVNGLRFARGHLVVSDGEWAVRLDELTAPGILSHLSLDVPPQNQGPPSTAEPQLEGALT